MKQLVVAGAALALAIVGAALRQVSATPAVSAADLQPRSVDCVFTNPQYAGTCVEQVTPEKAQTPVQACRVILNCLNDTRCVKTYCQATTIRGGWSLESPKEDKKTDGRSPR